MNLDERVEKIEKRNRRVGIDKAWERSLTRKCVVALLTYIVIVLFFISADLSNPFTNAIVPSLGFIISTFSLPYLKKNWIKYIYKRN